MASRGRPPKTHTLEDSMASEEKQSQLEPQPEPQYKGPLGKCPKCGSKTKVKEYPAQPWIELCTKCSWAKSLQR